MKKIAQALIFAIKEILTWHTMRLALISGLVVTAIWIGIGFVFWNSIVSLGAHILEWVPFSMVRSNGAWMLSSFLWLQLVLLTFALIFAFFGNLMLRHISQDKYTAFSVLTAIGSAVFWAIVWFFKGDYIYQEFLQLLTWLPFETVESTIGYLLGFYFIYSAIVVSMVFVVSLFSKVLLTSIEERCFPEDEHLRDHTFRSIGYTVKDTLLFAVISIVAFPVLFIPVLNFIVLIVLWMWLIKDTFQYDAASVLFEKVSPDKLKEHTVAIWIISFVTALFNFVPVFNIFGPFFGEVAMFHYLKASNKHALDR